MDDYESTVRSRELGRITSEAIRSVGLNGSQVAARLGWCPSRVSRFIHGHRRMRPLDLAAVLALCGIGGERRDAMIELAERAFEPSWTVEYGRRPPERPDVLASLESVATVITHVDVASMPGLLQSEEYARAVLRSLPSTPAEEIEEVVAQRVAHQDVLARLQTEFRFLLGERAITRTGLDDRVRSDQAHHLLRMSVLPNVEIRIVPETTDLGGASVPFALIESKDLNPVVYVENLNSVCYWERPGTVIGYRRIVEHLDVQAMNEHRSRTWLAGVAESLARTADGFAGPVATRFSAGA